MTTSPSTLLSPSDGRALASVAVQFFANGWVYATWAPRLPEIRDRVGISIGTLGVVLTLGYLSAALAIVVTPKVIARLGTRRVLIGGAVLSIGSLPLVGLATTPAVLVVGLVGVLFFDVFIDVAMNIQGSVLSARRHTPVMNRLHGLWSLATVFGGLTTAVLVGAGVGVTAHLLGVTALLILSILFVAPGLLPTDEPAEDPATEPADDEVDDSEAATVEATAPSRSRRFSPGMVALAVGGATAMTVELSASDWAAFRLSDDFTSAGRVAAAAFVAFTAGMTAGRLGGDFVLVRVGQRRLSQMSAVLTFAGLAVATLATTEVVVLAAFLVAGLGVSVLFPQLYDAAAQAPGPTGRGFTAMLLGQRTAALLTPLAIGALANTGALGVGDAMAIVALPAAAIIALMAFRPTTRDVDAAAR